MAQLNIRIDDDSRDLVDALARARGLSTSDLVRELIGQALGRDENERPRDDTTPRSLSAIERRRLAMQHEILALLTADETEKDGGWESQYHRRMIEVLNSGYTAEYYKDFQMIEPEMTDRECGLLHDILDMFTQIEWSVAKLSDEERAAVGEHAEYALKFGGFDGNDSLESRLGSYAEHLIKDGRWTNLADRFDDKHDRGNSHAPMLAVYQRMLTVWKPIKDKKIKAFAGPDSLRLSAEELRQILAAWPYPKE